MTEQLNPNTVLMNNINKLTHVLVLGITADGKLHMETNQPTYQFVNYILNRANFNINYMETNAQIQAESEKAALAEGAVANAVRENLEAEIEAVRPKRGRPRKVV